MSVVPPNAPPNIVLNSKRERPNLGYAVDRDSHKIRYISAKQILQFDDQQEGCPRKYANAYVFGRKLARPAVLDVGVDLAEILERYLRTGAMGLTPMLQPAAKFFPSPRNPTTGELDLLCEEPLGDIARAVELRDKILRSPNAPNLAEAQEEVRRLAGLAVRGIPFDGAADCVHRRGTYQDKVGATCAEPAGVVAACVDDLKSTSRINTRVTPRQTLQGWAQTDFEVTCDPQMLAYGKHRLDIWPDLTHVRLNKIYAQKKPHYAEIRGGLASRQQVEDRWGVLVDRVVDEMIQVAQAERISEVRASLGSCDSFTHVEICGFPGCGVGCPPGRTVVGVEAHIVEQGGNVPCTHCKGKGRTAPGCGYRGTNDCPQTATSAQVPIDINVSFDRSAITSPGAGMSLFDLIPTVTTDELAPPVPPTTSVPPVPPSAVPLDDASYQAQVAAEQAAFEAELFGQGRAMTTTATPTPPSPPTPPAVTPVAPALGEKISVALCAIGEEYMVDAEDGHAPGRMKLREVKAGAFKFVDGVGARVDLDVKDAVWRLPPNAPPAAPTPPPMTQPCGAPGCGVGCSPGRVVAPRPPGAIGEAAIVPCAACAGRGAVSVATMAVKPPDAPTTPWIDQQAPLSDEAIAEITDPKLKELAVEHKRLCQERERAAAQAEARAGKGGNCPGSGQSVLFAEQPTAYDGRVVCPEPGCGIERSIPKEIKKTRPMPAGMTFPNHRRPKAEATPTPPTPTSTPTTTPTPPGSIAVTSCEVGKTYVVFDHVARYVGTAAPPPEVTSLPKGAMLYLFERVDAPGANVLRLPPDGWLIIGGRAMSEEDLRAALNQDRFDINQRRPGTWDVADVMAIVGPVLENYDELRALVAAAIAWRKTNKRTVGAVTLPHGLAEEEMRLGTAFKETLDNYINKPMKS